MTEPGATAAPRLRWWKELLYILGFYLVYSIVRNTQGSASVSETHAFDNAKRVISVERHLGLFHEETIQHAFVHWHGFVEFWDVFYGTAHFVVTAFALIWMFRAFKDRYPVWRNTLACTTALALIGFAFFPLMPPRLLATVPGTHYGLIDTLKTFGGLWSFDSGAMQKVSNQYAAMPSLHFAWSLWCALVLIPQLRSRPAKVLAGIYPGLTLFAIVVTANHYFLDAVGGVAVLTMGYLLSRAIASVSRRAVPVTEARAPAVSDLPAGDEDAGEESERVAAG